MNKLLYFLLIVLGAIIGFGGSSIQFWPVLLDVFIQFVLSAYGFLMLFWSKL